MRVSYLELYNEELFDLLGSSECDMRMRIYDDSTKKVTLSGALYRPTCNQTMTG